MFEVGKEVMCIKPHETRPDLIAKGSIYTVQAITKMPCGCVSLDIGLKTDRYFIECHKHDGAKIISYNIFWLASCRFIPLDRKPDLSEVMVEELLGECAVG